MPECAKKDDCPRAIMMGGCEKCEHYITPDHYRLIKKADGNLFRGFLAGVIFSIVVVAIIIYC